MHVILINVIFSSCLQRTFLSMNLSVTLKWQVFVSLIMNVIVKMFSVFSIKHCTLYVFPIVNNWCSSDDNGWKYTFFMQLNGIHLHITLSCMHSIQLANNTDVLSTNWLYDWGHSSSPNVQLHLLIIGHWRICYKTVAFI